MSDHVFEVLSCVADTGVQKPLAVTGHSNRLPKARIGLLGGTKTMERDSWEDICNKCGKCCYEKVDLGAGLIHYTDEPCVHLDIETNLCKVYDKRHEVEPDCISLTAELVRYIHWLPEECAYLKYVRHQDTLFAVRNADNTKSRSGNPRRRKRNGHKNPERQ